MPNSKFVCHLSSSSKPNSEIIDENCRSSIKISCPKDCVCLHNIVDCKGLNLSDIPGNIPEYVTELYKIILINYIMNIKPQLKIIYKRYLQDNKIKLIRSGIFSSLKYLQKM
jgi:hypothetical protein